MEKLSLLKFERFIYLKEVDSTNQLAMTMTKESSEIDSCIYTFGQTAGRGQIGRFWYTGKDENLATTYLWNSVKLKAKEQFVLNMSFTLAIHDFLSKYIKEELCVKWPNDIYVGNKKIAGLLIQNVLRSDMISSSIMGVGININQDIFPDYIPNPTSLSNVTGQKYDLSQTLSELTHCVQERLSQLYLPSFNYKKLRAAYHVLLYRKNVISNFKIDSKIVSGIVKETTSEGKLIVELEEGLQTFNFREIGFVI